MEKERSHKKMQKARKRNPNTETPPPVPRKRPNPQAQRITKIGLDVAVPAPVPQTDLDIKVPLSPRIKVDLDAKPPLPPRNPQRKEYPKIGLDVAVPAALPQTDLDIKATITPTPNTEAPTTTQKAAIDDNLTYKIYRYQQLKKLTIPNYGIILIITLLLNGFGFIIGRYVLHDQQKIDWVIFAFIIIAFLICLILGWVKNHNAALFFNDRSKRYQSTYSDSEAKIKKYRMIVFCITLLLIISWLIVYFVFKK